MSKDDNKILNPQEYYKVNMENRLFINEEYLPLFLDEKMDWVLQ